MSMYKQLFVQHMDAKGIKYTDRDERSVKVSYAGDYLKSIPIYVFFDKDGDPLVALKCWDIATFKDKRDRAIVVCNELNSKYRWVKFYVDDDNDIIADADAMLGAATCGEECLSMVRRIVNIVDEAYPLIFKALCS